MTTPTPVLVTAADAATFAWVRQATSRVRRHRYGLTPRWSGDGASLYFLDDVAGPSLPARTANRSLSGEDHCYRQATVSEHSAPILAAVNCR